MAGEGLSLSFSRGSTASCSSSGSTSRRAPSPATCPEVGGHVFRQRVAGLGVSEVLTAPRAPWQNPYVEGLIGSVRRECLDHVVVLDERHLHRILAKYFDYYHQTRTHLSLSKDSPRPRPIQPRSDGEIVQLPEVGGLHHRYERRAA